MSGRWDKVTIRLLTGERVSAVAPVVVSASRATDIPAFYSEWLVNRLAAGYATWVNPFSGRTSYVSFERTRALVFWSKNPLPLMLRLAAIERLGFRNYYVQYTLNDYDVEGYEPGVPAVAERIATLRELAQRLGPDRVVWRFDPLLIGGALSLPALLDRVRRVRDGVAGYTRRLVISFVDVERYGAVRRHLARVDAGLREWRCVEMHAAADAIGRMARESGMSVGCCAEEVDLSAYGIEPNRCVDDGLMVRCFGGDAGLMAHLGVEAPCRSALGGTGEDVAGLRRGRKDTGQRKACGCVASKDIGRYGTCPHGCVYCYANGGVRPGVASTCRHDPAGELL